MALGLVTIWIVSGLGVAYFWLEARRAPDAYHAACSRMDRVLTRREERRLQLVTSAPAAATTSRASAAPKTGLIGIARFDRAASVVPGRSTFGS
jgi:hypothetical protein